MILNLCLLLAGALVLGRLVAGFGQPALLGHMMAGILLGPAALNWVASSNMLHEVANLAVLFVVITAGLEIRLSALTAIYRGRGVLWLMPGFLLPAATGFALAQCFAYDWLGATIIAMCLSITALPVALRILSGFGLLGTQLAQIAIAGALLADVIVLLTLGMLTPVAGANPASIGALVGLGALKLCALLGLVAAGAWASSRVHRYRGSPTRTTAAAQSTFALLLILLLAAASDALGLHFAIGAFLGALSVTEFHRDGGALHPLHRKLAGMVNFVFAPLFLACQGTQFTTGTLALTVFTTALTFAAIGSKLVGGYWSALCFGLARHEARGVAIVMNARGMMEMVIASIAFGAGLVDASLFSTLLIVGMITTMCTPLLLRQWQQHQALA